MWTLLSPLAILALAAGTHVSSSDFAKLDAAFKKFNIVPQLIPESPLTKLSKIYPYYETNLGNIIPPCSTTSQGFPTWPNARNNTFYTFVSIDLDYPQYFATNGYQYINGLIFNSDGPDLAAGDVIAYHGGFIPFPGTGYHRYLTLIFKQPGRITITDDILFRYSLDRTTFKLHEFIARFRLGRPVSGNFFRSRAVLTDECADYSRYDNDQYCQTECFDNKLLQ